MRVSSVISNITQIATRLHSDLQALDVNDHTQYQRYAFVTKQVTETVNNSAVLQDDNELVLAVEANEVCRLHVELILNTWATSDFKCTFTVPALATLYGTWNLRLGSSSTESYIFQRYDLTGNIVIGGNADHTNVLLVIDGVYIGGANAGDIQLQWAQNAAQANDTQVVQYSTMVKRRMD